MNEDSPDPAQENIRQVQLLFVRHQSAIRAFVRALQPSLFDADDILQETFLILTRKADSFEPGSNFVAWACSVARLKVLEDLRKKRRSSALTEAALEALAAEAPAEEITELREATLNGCLQGLGAKASELLWRKYVGRQTSEEMAEGLRMTPLAVRVALSKARALLRDCVSIKLQRAR
ncbi:MAG: hypothetical protein RLZZ399_2421 [Verrucomicrobiota bacterium]|jgi:RNA polymerase sigma-70 factor (ECF subfamily)